MDESKKASMLIETLKQMYINGDINVNKIDVLLAREMITSREHDYILGKEAG